ncbi:DUF6172 family protein [Pseudoalteromonas tunicata]|uniref:Orphan protein n=1 Tax=Pseudoalteromonas tunicata D2 TaxID=87626 RepID=A4C879_9GAMM|nr:DUF6172 family protein [Pseudoalteromonas tunicata]ATC93299.1 hypothetical protein PTUN_a0518 [Pseudoalteromonas tunicata]AXT32352.1 hypothetical protein D1819_16980 [Pseudoalteromonas tunicata]EAR28794.1 hypothetical protein PTD2_07119 [Pseudoalteromonas tunicata D2]MDP4982201.1 DUF6172 family protein [Pseudoalteromonas tunicata]MDP5213478.1 DUF6172 family protein [Pseudoalteromonas tunicata]
MKKTFVLSHPKIKLERLVDSFKFEAKKYIKRERNKKLPEGADFWDFDCRFGQTEEVAEEIRLSAINKCIDDIVSQNHGSFYLEILAKPGFKNIDFGDDE